MSNRDNSNTFAFRMVEGCISIIVVIVGCISLLSQVVCDMFEGGQNG